MIVANICLDDIKSKKSEKNGKTYATIVIEPRKEADKLGNTHSVSNSQSKDERAEKKKKEYCGSAKEYTFSKKEYNNINKQEDEDLPF